MSTTKHYTIYTDAFSTLTAPGPGGWAVCLYEDGSSEPRVLTGGFQKTTNNRMQIHTVTVALEAVEDGCSVDIFSRSEYVCNAISKAWVINWALADWMSRGRSPIKNRDLWEVLLPHLKKCRIAMHWVATPTTEQSRLCEVYAKRAVTGDLGFDPAYPGETLDPNAPAPRKRGRPPKRSYDGGTVTIYTDGSCLGNPGPGGWAAIVCKENAEPKEMCGGYRRTTNNRMEILSVIEALAALEQPSCVELYSDSQYVCNAIEKRWLKAWMRNNWQTSTNNPVKNQDLWRRLAPLLENHKVTFHWLRGHAGHAENERCDYLARSCAEWTNLPEDLGFIQG